TGEASIPAKSSHFDRDRFRATIRLFRHLRHELATPLSGAALHLEVACRRLAQGADLEATRALENIRMGQLEIGYVSAMLDVLTGVVRAAADKPGWFSLPGAIVGGGSRSAPDPLRGVALELPAAPFDPEVVLFGSARQLERAIAALTFYALRSAPA